VEAPFTSFCARSFPKWGPFLVHLHVPPARPSKVDSIELRPHCRCLLPVAGYPLVQGIALCCHGLHTKSTPITLSGHIRQCLLLLPSRTIHQILMRTSSVTNMGAALSHHWPRFTTRPSIIKHFGTSTILRGHLSQAGLVSWPLERPATEFIAAPPHLQLLVLRSDGLPGCCQLVGQLLPGGRLRARLLLQARHLALQTALLRFQASHRRADLLKKRMPNSTPNVRRQPLRLVGQLVGRTQAHRPCQSFTCASPGCKSPWSTLCRGHYPGGGLQTFQTQVLPAEGFKPGTLFVD
jgi:hypothetical protein